MLAVFKAINMKRIAQASLAVFALALIAAQAQDAKSPQAGEKGTEPKSSEAGKTVPGPRGGESYNDPFGSGPGEPSPPPPKNEGILDKLRRLGCGVESDHVAGTLRVKCGSPKMTTDNVVALAELGNLASFDVPMCPISQPAMERLAKNQKLVYVNLRQTQITDEGVKAIAKLPNLRSLDLSQTPITSVGVASLKGHPALRELNLRRTHVDNAGIESLSGNKNFDVAQP